MFNDFKNLKQKKVIKTNQIYKFVTFTIIHPCFNRDTEHFHYWSWFSDPIVFASNAVWKYTHKWWKLITACVFAQCRWVCWRHMGIHSNSSSVALVPDPLKRRIHSLPAHSSCRHGHGVIQSLTLPPQHLQIYLNKHTKIHFPFILSRG